jgi:hypothetical protein
VLLRRATEALREVIEERGFSGGSVDSYTPESFGDCLIVFESPEFLVRLVRDRGQLFIDVRTLSDSSPWWSLGHLVGFLEGEAEPRAIEGLELNCEVLTAYAERIFDRDLLLDRAGRLESWAGAWAARAFSPRTPQ